MPPAWRHLQLHEWRDVGAVPRGRRVRRGAQAAQVRLGQLVVAHKQMQHLEGDVGVARTAAAAAAASLAVGPPLQCARGQSWEGRRGDVEAAVGRDASEDGLRERDRPIAGGARASRQRGEPRRDVSHGAGLARSPAAAAAAAAACRCLLRHGWSHLWRRRSSSCCCCCSCYYVVFPPGLVTRPRPHLHRREAVHLEHLEQRGRGEQKKQQWREQRQGKRRQGRDSFSLPERLWLTAPG